MKILICSDGSEPADRALRLGAAIAGGCRAEVTLLGILETPGQSRTILQALERGQALLEDKKIHAELITKTGEPIREIIQRTEETQYDLVVIGTARKEARGAFWMSSKSYKIIKEIKPPVLSVSGQSRGISRILICSGGKRSIDNALRLTGEIARGVAAAVTLLHVMPEPPAFYAHWPKMDQTADWLLSSDSELGINLRRGKDALEALGVAVQVRLRRGSVVETILHEIREGGYDLVVTGSALSRGLRTYALGDISREIVNRAPCPVLVVRSQEQLPHLPFGLRQIFGRFTAE